MKSKKTQISLFFVVELNKLGLHVSSKRCELDAFGWNITMSLSKGDFPDETFDIKS